MKSPRSAVLLTVLLCCALSVGLAQAAEFESAGRSSYVGSTSESLGEEFPEFVRWLVFSLALGEEFPEFSFWPLWNWSALGEEFPEFVSEPRREGLGEEFPE